MLYDGFIVVDSRESPMREYGENNFCGDFRGNKLLNESAYDTYAGPGGAPGSYGPYQTGGGASSGPLPGLGGAGYGQSTQKSGGSGGGAGQYVNADTLAAGTNLLGSVFGMIGANKASKGPLAGNVKAVCGRKPLFNIKGKKDAYLACAEKVANPQPVYTPPAESSNKGLIIGLIIAVVLIGIIITVVLVMKNKKAAVAVA
jgi:hypothetical protein